MFDFEKAFPNTRVNEKVAVFYRTALNILNNFIPHETIVMCVMIETQLKI